jgi:phytoene dehydrogenase-like protein
MNYDAIVIGAGHNGLVTAARLAKAGKKVLVLERRPIVGGAAVTEEPYPGFRYTTCSYSPGMFQESISRELGLRNLGYETIESDPALYAPAPDGTSLWFWKDDQRTVESIAQQSKHDAGRYIEFQNHVDQLISFIRPLFQSPLPDPATAGPRDWKELLSLAWKFHKLREKDVLELLRVMPQSIMDYLNEFFEGEHLKGVLASEGIMGSFYGPRSQGSVYVMMYLRMGRGDGSKQAWPFIRGGMGSLSNAIAQAAQNHGAEIRTGVEVEKVLIENGRATGVVLSNGQELKARLVVSNADAKRTFLKMVDPLHLDPGFVTKIRAIKSRGVSAKVNLALDRYPKWKGLKSDETPANICIAPNMDYLEKAFDDAKYGDYSKSPFLDIGIPSVVDSSIAPAGKHVMSVYILFAPYHLKQGDWNAKREAFGNNVVRTIEEYAPGFSESILHKQVVTPLDLETEFGMTEGHIHHGEISLDQILFMRPVPGYSRYRTPIEGLYLCGASAHPGGGVTGLPGSLAASEILTDFKSGKVPQA